MKKLKPIEDRIIVKALEAEGVTKGGVIIPDLGQEMPMKGKVLSVGPGRITEHGILLGMAVKEGDVVIFPIFGPMKFKEDDEEFIILKQSDVLAIIENVSEGTYGEQIICTCDNAGGEK